MQHDDACSNCGAPMPAGSVGWWEDWTASARCEPCFRAGPDDTPAAGRRRSPGRAHSVDPSRRGGKHGRFTVASDDPRLTNAWARGSDAERRLARHLGDDLIDAAVVLHDRVVPKTRATVDHVVVAPSGVWVIDARTDGGRVEVREIGGRAAPEERLYLANRDWTRHLDACADLGETVRLMLTRAGIDLVPILPVLCLTSADWGPRALPLLVGEVVVAWPAAVLAAIVEDDGLDDATVDRIARALAAKLPANR